MVQRVTVFGAMSNRQAIDVLDDAVTDGVISVKVSKKSQSSSTRGAADGIEVSSTTVVVVEFEHETSRE